MSRLFLASSSLSALLVTGVASGQTPSPGQLNANVAGPPTGQNQSQGAAAPNEPAGSGKLEEVVVTAQKRRETAQKIPGALVTLSSQTLSRSGVRDFDTIQKVLPDVHVEDLVGGATNITIRGVRESAVGPTSDSPTAVHLDGVYLSRATGLSGLFYDLQRIEELPGPQGTLYGRNATGGVLNLITNKPTDTLGGYLEGEGGNYGLYRFNGAVNAPVSPTLDVRGAFHFYHHDGYFSNGFDDADQKGGRLSARAKLGADATLLVSADYQDSYTTGSGSALFKQTFSSLQLPPGVPRPPVLNPPMPSDPFTANSFLYPLGVGPSFQDSKTFGAQAQFDDDFGWAVLTTQLAVRRLDFNGNQIDLADTIPAPKTDSYESTPSDSTTYSAEARLASEPHTPLQWVVGLYYFTEKTSGDYCQHATFTSPGCVLEFANPFQRDISYAAFGQATYTPPVLSEKLHLTGGLRFNTDKKNATSYTKSTFLALPGSDGYLSRDPNDHATFSAVTYKAEISYDLTPQNLIYAQNSTGFRAGGFAYGRTPEYKPETIQAWEIGSKNRFLNDTLQINLAGYHYIYKNQERNVMSLPPPGAPPYIPFSDLSVQSIGKSHYTGASMALEWAVTPDDRLGLNVQYLAAHYVQFQIPSRYVVALPLSPTTGLPIPGEIPGNENGFQILNTPPWSGTFSYDHVINAYRGLFDARVAIDWSVEQHYLENYTNTLQYQLGTDPGYARLDLSLSYAPERGGWRITGYVNNVTDSRNFTGNFYERTPLSGTVDALLLPPRTFGVILSAKF